MKKNFSKGFGSESFKKDFQINFPNESKFTPYIGLGLGSSTFSAKDQTATVSGTRYSLKGTEESVFSYAAKGGADYEISDNTSLYSEVTYQKFASYDVTEPGYETVNYDSHDLFAVSIGLKFNF